MTPFHPQPWPRNRGAASGFTLIEILVAATVTIILVGILLTVSTVTGNAVKQSSAKLTAFSTARTAFDVMTQKLSQATLNTYLDYYQGGARRNPSNAAGFRPTSYGRASDLQFYIRANVQNGAGNITGNHGQEVYFQAPVGYSDTSTYQAVQGLLNVCGFYVAYGDSKSFQPEAVTVNNNHRYRYRLMQGLEPTESFSVFAQNIGDTSAVPAWINNITNGTNGPAGGSAYVTPLADNVIALVIWPRLSMESDPVGTSLTTNYTYNSQFPVEPTGASPPYTQPATADQLPPNVRVTMVAIDEPSMIRLNQLNNVSPNGSAAPPKQIENALKNLFTDETQYSADISSLISALSAQHVSFQIFDATVAMRESKWSQNPVQ